MVNMDKKIKAKWIKALRSGKYKQGKQYLKSRGRYCCLGVLCEVLGMKPTRENGRWIYEDSSTVLPSQAMRTARIYNNQVGVRWPVQFRDENHFILTGLNDAGASFKFIADVIEKQL